MKFFKKVLIFFSGAFKDTGDISMARLQSFMLVCTGIILCFHAAYLWHIGKSIGEELALIGIVFTNAFATKQMGKSEETKLEIAELQNNNSKQ